jgi:hypothetical protein
VQETAPVWSLLRSNTVTNKFDRKSIRCGSADDNLRYLHYATCPHELGQMRRRVRYDRTVSRY